MEKSENATSTKSARGTESHAARKELTADPIHTEPRHNGAENATELRHDGAGNALKPRHDDAGNAKKLLHDGAGNATEPRHDGAGISTEPRHDGAGNVPEPRHDDAGKAKELLHDDAGNAKKLLHNGAGISTEPRHNGAGNASEPRHDGAGNAKELLHDGAGNATELRHDVAGNAKEILHDGAGNASELHFSSAFINQPSEDLAAQVETLKMELQGKMDYIGRLERIIQDFQNRSRTSGVETRNLPQQENETNVSQTGLVSSIGQTIGTPASKELRDVYNLHGNATELRNDGARTFAELRNNVEGNATQPRHDGAWNSEELSHVFASPELCHGGARISTEPLHDIGKATELCHDGAGDAKELLHGGAGNAIERLHDVAGNAKDILNEGAGNATELLQDGAETATELRHDSVGNATELRHDIVGNATELRHDGAGTVTELRHDGAGKATEPYRDGAVTATGPTYKGAGIKESVLGILYQLDLLMLTMKRGLDQRCQFMMATEVEDAGSLDDLTFKYEKNGETVLRFLQAKHKINKKKLKQSDFLNETKEDFSIKKYFMSYYDNIRKSILLQGKYEDFIIWTNADVQNIQDFDPILETDPLFSFEVPITTLKKPERLKLKKVSSLYKELEKILKNAVHEYIAEELGGMMIEEHLNISNEDILKESWTWLMENIFDVNSATSTEDETYKFKQNFLFDPDEYMANINDILIKTYISKSKMKVTKNNALEEIKDQVFKIYGVNLFDDLPDYLTESTDITKPIEDCYRSAAKELGTMAANSSIIFVKPVLRDHRAWMMEFIFNGSMRLRTSFLEPQNKYVHSIHEIFFKSYLEQRYENMKEKVKNDLSDRLFIIDKSITKSDGASQSSDKIAFFLDRLVIAVNQPSENVLYENFKKEISEKMKLADSEIPAIFIQSRILNWLKKRKGQFLTYEDCEKLYMEVNSKITNLALTSITQRKLSKIAENNKYNCTFDAANKVVECLSDFLNEQQRSLMLLYYKTRLLTEIKVMQLVQSVDYYDKYMFVDMRDVLRLFNTKTCPVKAFISGECQKMFVVVSDSSELNDDANEIFNLLLKRLNHKQILIMLPSELQDMFKQKTAELLNNLQYIEHNDLGDQLDDFSECSQSALREAAIVFQGCVVSIGKLLDYDKTFSRYLNGDVLTELLRGKYEIQVTEPKDEYNIKGVSEYYVDRRVSKQIDTNNCELKIKCVNDIEDKIVIVKGGLGSGKSSLLSHIASETKKQQLQCDLSFAKDNMCIIKANLGNYCTPLYDTLKKVMTETKAIEFLYIFSNLGSYNEITKQEIKFEIDNFGHLIESKHFEQSLHLRFFKYLYNHEKIVLLLDAFDEIAPHYAEKVIEMLMKLKTSRIFQIWITTRPYIDITNNLEMSLDVKTYELQNLSEQEVVEVLKGFCKKKGFQIELEQLERLVKKDLLLIPQQLIMTATIWYEEERMSNYNLERQKLNSSSLYEKFIDYTFKELFKSIDLKHPIHCDTYDEKYNTFITDHKHLALMECFLNEDLPEELLSHERREELLAKVKEIKEKAGLVMYVMARGPRFLHYSYAEYFAARFLADVLTSDCHNKIQNESKKFLYKIVQNERYRYNLFYFFNYRILELTSASTEDKKIFTAAIEGDSNEFKRIDATKLTTLRDCLGRSPIHLYLTNNIENDDDVLYFVNKYLIPSFKSDSQNGKLKEYTNITHALEKDRLFGWTALHYLALFQTKFDYGYFTLTSKLSIRDQKVLQDIYGRTPLMFSKPGAVFEFLAAYCKDIIDVQDNSGKTALHYALLNTYFTVNVKHLLDNGAELHGFQDYENNMTPLDLMISDPDKFIFYYQQLSDYIQINERAMKTFYLPKFAKNKKWCAYLLSRGFRIAAAMLEVMKAKGIDVNVCCPNGWTALHFACHDDWHFYYPYDRIKFLCFLIMHGANEEAENKHQDIPSDYWDDDFIYECDKYLGVEKYSDELEKEYGDGYRRFLKLVPVAKTRRGLSRKPAILWNPFFNITPKKLLEINNPTPILCF